MFRPAIGLDLGREMRWKTIFVLESTKVGDLKVPRPARNEAESRGVDYCWEGRVRASRRATCSVLPYEASEGGRKRPLSKVLLRIFPKLTRPFTMAAQAEPFFAA